MSLSQPSALESRMCGSLLLVASLLALSAPSLAQQVEQLHPPPQQQQQASLKRQDPSQSFMSDTVKPIQAGFPVGSHLAKPAKVEEEEDGFIMQAAQTTTRADTSGQVSEAPAGSLESSSTLADADQSIPIDSNRQQFITHDQLSASTKDENISIAAPSDEGAESSLWSQSRHSNEQAVKSQRANTSKVSYVSSLFSDLLSYASSAASARPLESNTSTSSSSTNNNNNNQEEDAKQLSSPAESGQACPGICRNIFAASILCNNEIDAICPSVFQKCCDKSDLAFNGTPVETSAPITSPDFDPSNPTPLLDSLPQAPAQANRSAPFPPNDAGLHNQHLDEPDSGRSRGAPKEQLDSLGSRTLYFLSSSSGDSQTEPAAAAATLAPESQQRPAGQVAQPAHEQAPKPTSGPDPAAQPADLPIAGNSTANSYLTRRLEAAEPAGTNESQPDASIDQEGLLTSDGSSELSNPASQDDTRPKCLGFCSLPLFTLLCDNSYDSPDCEPSRKCCIVNDKIQTEDQSPPTSPASADSIDQPSPTVYPPTTKISQCRGSCLPVYHSSLCIKPNQVQLDSPGCLPSFVCCVQPANLQDGTNQLDDSLPQEHQPSESFGLRAEATQPVGLKDSSLIAALIPPTPPGADSLIQTNTQTGDLVSARQRPFMDSPAGVGVSRQPTSSSPVDASKQEQVSSSFGGIMNQLYSMFKLNSGNKQRPKSPQPAVAQVPYTSVLEIQPYSNEHQYNGLHNQMHTADPYTHMSPVRPDIMTSAHSLPPVHQVVPPNVGLQQVAPHSPLSPQHASNFPAHPVQMEPNRQAQMVANPQRQAIQNSLQQPMLGPGPQVTNSPQQQQPRPNSMLTVSPNRNMHPAYFNQYQVVKQTNAELAPSNINRIAQQPAVASYPAVHFPPNRQYSNLAQMSTPPPSHSQHQQQQQQQRYQQPQAQQVASNQMAASQQHQISAPVATSKQTPSIQIPADQDRVNNKFTQPVVAQRLNIQPSSPIRTGSGEFHELAMSQPNLEQRPGSVGQRYNSWAPSNAPVNVEAGAGHSSALRTSHPVRATDAPVGIASEHLSTPEPKRSQQVSQRTTARPTSRPASSRPKQSAEQSGLFLNPSSSNLNVLISNGPYIDLQRVTEIKHAEEPPRTVNKQAPCSGVCLTPTEASHCTHPLQIEENQTCAQPHTLCCVKLASTLLKNDREPNPGSRPAIVETNKLESNLQVSDPDDQLSQRKPVQKSPSTSTQVEIHQVTPAVAEDKQVPEVPKVTRDHDMSCGKPHGSRRQTSGLTRARVMGGFDAKPGYWCWQVALMNDKNEYLCGGALIGTKWVLTAAHCITQHLRSENQLYARLGHHDLNSTQGSDGAKNIKVKTSYVHHNHNGITLDNDIALLRLASSVELDDPSICLVCLPERNSQVGPGRRCTVTGYGFESESGPAALKVRQTELPIVADGDCQNKTSAALGKPFTLPASSFCAGGELGQDACHGDGGSPLSCLVDGYYELTGIVSWGYKCGNKDLPGLYSKVSSFVGWINQIVSANN